MYEPMSYNTHNFYDIPTSLGFNEVFMAFFAVIMLVIIAILLVNYVLNGILFMKLAKKANISQSWLAWLPYGPEFLMTKIARINPMFLLVPIGVSMLTWATNNPLAIGILAVSNIGYYLYVSRKIFENFGKNPDLAFLILIPVIGGIMNLVNYFRMAFGEDAYIEGTTVDYRDIPRSDDNFGGNI